MADEAKLHSLVYSTFDMLVLQYAIGTVMEKNWALSIDQCWL